MNTPWGQSDNRREYARGFGFVSTPSHGGIYMTQGFADEVGLSAAARKRAETRGKNLFWEEDVKWAIPLWDLPAWRDKARGVDEAAGIKSRTPEEFERDLWHTLSGWYPDYLLDVGVEPEPEGFARWEERRRLDRMSAERHPDLVVSAAGDRSWRRVPEGLILVQTADGLCHLVTEVSYDNRQSANLLSNLDVLERDVRCMD